jgi:XTP/dITP diphosphohydrolase
MVLYVATSNAGKLRDFDVAARTFAGVELRPLARLERIAPPVEDADTFEGNALIKARAYSALAPGEIVVADDSGIVVAGLGGAPGVRSARYAEDSGFVGEGSVDERNLDCLLQRAAALEDRAAAYVCVLAAVRDGELLATGTGSVEGELLRTRRGTGGFGYDPVFLLPELELTMAEVDMQTRMGLSHRGRALVDLICKLRGQDFGLRSNFAQSLR